MTGTAIITWHDEKPRYDEVIWDPHPRSREEAAELAQRKLRMDARATRVHVEYRELHFVEAMRGRPGSS